MYLQLSFRPKTNSSTRIYTYKLKKMEQSTIDFLDGQVEFNNLPYLFTDSSIDSFYLKEDILLVKYGDKSIDVGFYGDKKLKIQIIERMDWSNPIYMTKINKNKITKDFVFQEINNAIKYLDKYLKSNQKLA